MEAGAVVAEWVSGWPSGASGQEDAAFRNRYLHTEQSFYAGAKPGPGRKVSHWNCMIL